MSNVERDRDIVRAQRLRQRWRKRLQCESLVQRLNGNYEDQLIMEIEDLQEEYAVAVEQVIMFRSRVAALKAAMTDLLIEADKLRDPVP